MTFDLPMTERRLKSTARVMHQSMWLLFLVAVGLMLIVRRSVAVRTGSFWVLGCALLAIMFSFALRDMVRKLGRRNAEDQIVKDVKTFLQRQDPAPVEPPTPVKEVAVAAQPAAVPGDAFVPSRSADFLELKGALPGQPEADLVVFDAFPCRESASFRMNFHAILQPVVADAVA